MSTAKPQAKRAAAEGELAGVWRLRGYSRQYVETGEVETRDVDGYFLYTPGGHMFTIAVEGGRPVPGTLLNDAERAEQFKAIIGAYCGTYVREGDMARHRIEVAWNEGWRNSEQVRQVLVEGDALIIQTTPRAGDTDGRVFVNTLTWTRVESFATPESTGTSGV